MDRPMMEYHAGNVAEGRYVIRSCFGGVKSAFVASGSEVRTYVDFAWRTTNSDSS